MAGDWFKLEHATIDKPEVIRLSEILGIEQDCALGKLCRFWRWCNEQSVDGNALGVTESFLDRLTNCPGFSAGLVEVGWLTSRNNRLSVPKFDRHNGQTAKSRALTKDRMKRLRDGTIVTESSPEKRREEKRVDTSNDVSTARKKFVPPTVDQVRAYCIERDNHIDPQAFVDHYTSNGWRVGKSPMKDWQASVRTWEKNNLNKEPAKPSSKMYDPATDGDWRDYAENEQ